MKMCGMMVAAAMAVGGQWAAAGEAFEWGEYESAGISGLEWDKAFAGSLVVDAIHRNALVRFPGSAEALAEKLNGGNAIAKAEVVLAYDGYELYAPHYIMRHYIDVWTNSLPEWHVQAWALRRPWRSPTFNAAVGDVERGGSKVEGGKVEGEQGMALLPSTFDLQPDDDGGAIVYWTKYGARDTEHDRYPTAMEPVELSHRCEARIDVTALLNDTEYGETLRQRLARFEACGLILKKWEDYDFRYRYHEWWSSYEWAIPTGGMGLMFTNPRLVVELEARSKVEGGKVEAEKISAGGSPVLQPSTFDLQPSASGGQPTAVWPDEAEVKAIAERTRIRQPSWMPDWQWARVGELRGLGGDGAIGQWANAIESGDKAKYDRFLSEVNCTPLRHWKGWDVQSDLILWYLYKDALPPPVQDHVKRYWESYLMPDKPTDYFIHAQSRENETRWLETKDWRGNSSFFRAGYNHVISTMNFNHTASMGALLGGAIIGSEYAMADGRHGLEYLPLRFHVWQDGTTQESIDHYYFSVTLSGQKMFVDFSPTEFDRLMGKSILAKSVEELTSSYHPALRRMISPGGRTGTAYLWVAQDGLQHILHTLSHSGALHDVGNANTFGMKLLGSDCPPGRVALQSIQAPWAPEWVANMVDEKPIPYEMTVAETALGKMIDAPRYKKTYLGHHYGIASTDLPIGGAAPFLAQWRRGESQVSTIQEVGTLLARTTFNAPDFITTYGAGGKPLEGRMVTLQHKNKAIVLMPPFTEENTFTNLMSQWDYKPGQGITSLQASLALVDFQESPTWKLYVDGSPMTALPFTMNDFGRITIQDGVTYIGIVPIATPDTLGRGAAPVLVSADDTEHELQGGGRYKASLLIQQFNYRSDTPLRLDAKEALLKTYGGFVVVMGDSAEYGTFQEFQKLIHGATIEARWNEAGDALHLAYKDAADTLEMGYAPALYPERTHLESFVAPRPDCLLYRRANGEFPYLPKGIYRDSTLTQQGTRGRLEKNGATLVSQPGRMTYLQTEPVSGTVTGYNPLPDPTLWEMETPGGILIRADGAVGLMCVAVNEKENTIWLDYGVRPDETAENLANALVVTEMKGKPTVYRDGKNISETVHEEYGVYIVPLGGTMIRHEIDAIHSKCLDVGEKLFYLLESAPDGMHTNFVHDWYIVGPFDNPNFSEVLWNDSLAVTYPPAREPFDPAAEYTGKDGQPLRWFRWLEERSKVEGGKVEAGEFAARGNSRLQPSTFDLQPPTGAGPV
ncbi:MAG: hypothetical protein FWF84_03560, partial [Kiritimatiellaeota bacterium]|nr:hypothetical protein [Kiritimatiellota bacterium]